MTPLSLTPEQHRSLWAGIAEIKDAMSDLREVAEHHRILGLGDLNRRISTDQVRTITAAEKVAQILESAAQQTEGRV